MSMKSADVMNGGSIQDLVQTETIIPAKTAEEGLVGELDGGLVEDFEPGDHEGKIAADMIISILAYG